LELIYPAGIKIDWDLVCVQTREAILDIPNWPIGDPTCLAHYSPFKPAARKPGDSMGAIAEALAVDGPAIVDAVVAADEMPNMPHVELEQVGNYAIAKIKEAVLAVTGG
jgi:hypothetical protein